MSTPQHETVTVYYVGATKYEALYTRAITDREEAKRIAEKEGRKLFMAEAAVDLGTVREVPMIQTRIHRDPLQGNRFQAQYRNSDDEPWFDIGDVKNTKLGAEESLMEFKERYKGHNRI
ncbi:hypothetical protein [Nocardia jiangxiensis]|uniref:hypothetical protein n=1 Tax=Nocardia jiangxiensis TaxID=282685 RepID=UPI0002FC0FCD|nr:hypothetical protein [Nocardia jiangxiensis]